MPMSPRLLRPRAAGGFNPRTIAGLALWLDFSDSSTLTLSGSSLSEVRDKSGNGRAAVQATGANQPTLVTNAIGARSVASFDGSNDTLGVASFPAMTEASVFAVCYRNWPTPGGFRTVLSQGYASASGAAFFVQASGTTADIVSGDLFSVGNGFNSGRAPRQIGALGTRQANATLVMSCVLATTNAGQWVNGTAVSERVSLSGTMSVASGTLNIGFDGISAYSDHKIAEVLVYFSALSASQRRTIEAWLGQRYGVAVA